MVRVSASPTEIVQNLVKLGPNYNKFWTFFYGHPNHLNLKTKILWARGRFFKLEFANHFIIYQKRPFRGRFGPGRLHSELWARGVKVNADNQSVVQWMITNREKTFFIPKNFVKPDWNIRWVFKFNAIKLMGNMRF